MKWILAVLLAVVAVALIVGVAAGLVWLAVLYPVWVFGAAFLVGAGVAVWFFTLQFHTWLVDRAYVRHKRQVKRAESAFIAEERANLVRAER